MRRRGHWVAAGCADACGALQGLGGVQECLNRALRMRAPQVLMNGRPLGVQFKRNSAYVAQEDCFVPTMSAWETLKFTATLTLPKVIGPRGARAAHRGGAQDHGPVALARHPGECTLSGAHACTRLGFSATLIVAGCG